MTITRGNTIGTFILIAGDRDYSYMLESIRDQGVGVVVMAPKGTACSSSCLLWPEAAITAGSLPELTGNSSPPGVISLPISAKSQSRHPKLEVLEPPTGAMEQDVELGDHPQDTSMDVDSDAEVKAAPLKRTEGHPVKSKVANKDETSSVAGSDSESMEPIIVNAPGSQPSRFAEHDNSDEDYLLSSGVEAQAKDETAVEYHRRTTSTSRSLGDDNEGSSEDEEGASEQEDSGDEDEDEEEESSDDEDGTEDEPAVESDNDDESSDASAEEDNCSLKNHRLTTSTSLGHDNGAEGDSQGSSGDDRDRSEQEDSDDDDEDGEESEEESRDGEDGTEDESAVESCNHESSEEEDSDNESEEEDTDDSEDESEPDDTVTATGRKRKRKPQNRSPDCAQPNGSTNGKPPRKQRRCQRGRSSEKAKIES